MNENTDFRDTATKQDNEDLTPNEIAGKLYELREDNISEYFADKRFENFRLLEKKNKDLARIYVGIIETMDSLSFIKIVLKTDVTRFSPAGKTKYGSSYEPQVILNLDKEFEEEPDAEREKMLKKLAIDFGAKYNDVLKNKKLTQAFIFLEAMGCASDFVESYLMQKDPINIVNALREAIDDYENDTKTGEINQKAWNFAVNYIVNHYDRYFLDPSTEPDDSGRVRTGEEIVMNEEEIEIAGLRSDESVNLDFDTATEITRKMELGPGNVLRNVFTAK